MTTATKVLLRESNNSNKVRLLGKLILVTRAAGQAEEFACLLKAKGARVLEYPTIRIAPPESYADLDVALKTLTAFDWVVFTSRNAVGNFVERLQMLDLDVSTVNFCRICAVGPKTAELLHDNGVRVDLIASNYTGEGVVAAFAGLEMTDRWVLFPKGDCARDVVIDGLLRQGAHVRDLITYRNLPQDKIPTQLVIALEERQIDCVTFTASSTVTNLASLLGEQRFAKLLQGVVIASIGPITSKTCNKFGLEVHVEPSEYTIKALTEEIAKYFDRVD